jgi:hypothetical protein
LSLSFSFSYQNTECIYLSSHACYTHRLSHPPLFDKRNNIRRRVRIVKLLSTCFWEHKGILIIAYTHIGQN